MKAVNLRTEYLHNPIGIDITAPRFYWNCEGGVKQTAYQIVAKRGGEVVWDSGKVESSSMTHIQYVGKTLNSRDRVEWFVTLWDENGAAGETAFAWFELGLLKKSDWSAKWITGGYMPKKHMRYPADCFKKSFAASKAVERARLYITACGLYEAKINGVRVGDFRLAPGCTDYRYRLQYQAYDVTAMISEQNALTVQLADGWYRGSVGCFGKTNVYGRETALLCQLEITYKDGKRDTIISDGDFSWSNDGPVRFADLEDGEVYDASKAASFSGKARLTDVAVTPTASDNVFLTQHEEFTPKLIITPSGKKLLDFGQNIAGFIAFFIKGKKGQKVTVWCNEVLDENGELMKDTKHHKPVKEFGKLTELLLMLGQERLVFGELQPTPKQQVVFTCSGGEDFYKMEFGVFGFQYAEVETDAAFKAEDFKAIAVYSDMERTGDFACSNIKVNRFFQNTVWSMKSNFLDIPTDCPQRERLGWTGDGQVFFETAHYIMNAAPIYRKWLQDFTDAQMKNGKISAVIPYAGMSMTYDSTGGSAGWGEAAIIIPYRFWKRFGDESILRGFYGLMRNYAMFMINHTGHKRRKDAKANPYHQYIYEKGVHLGEWLEPKEFQDKPTSTKTEEATAYLHYAMSLMYDAANALGKTDDAKIFKEYADGAMKAYNHLFVKNETIDTDRQAKLVRPLALGLLDGDVKRNVQNRLVKAVENRRYCITTGFLSTPFVLQTLTKAGRADAAYKMLENETAPSWLAEVNAGATTVWENWDGTDSHNHYSPGAVCGWLFDTAAGIRADGENRFIIAPTPGGTFTFAKAEYASLYGKVAVYWEKTGDGYRCEITVPPNVTADVILQNGTRKTVTAGNYRFEGVSYEKPRV